MSPMKRQPSGLLTVSVVFIALAALMAVLSGDLLLVLAVGSAIAGIMVLSRPSRVAIAAHTAMSRSEAVESRRSVPSERVVVHPAGRATAKGAAATRLRSRHGSGPQTRPYAVSSDSTFPVIQVLL